MTDKRGETTPKTEKSAPKAEKSVDAAAEAPMVSETGVTPGPEVPPQIVRPVERYQVGTPEPFRAGGHVLTERGWELDPDAQLATEQPATDQRAADQRDTEQEH